MTEAKKRRLSLAPPIKREGPSYALIRQAVRLFRSDLVPRATRRHNARQWLRSVEMLGDKHVYKGGEARWGHKKASA